MRQALSQELAPQFSSSCETFISAEENKPFEIISLCCFCLPYTGGDKENLVPSRDFTNCDRMQNDISTNTIFEMSSLGEIGK